MAFSANLHPFQPEILEVCDSAIQSWCGFKDYPECTMMFRIEGITPNMTSFYRMKVFNGTNNIVPGTPIASNIEKPGEW